MTSSLLVLSSVLSSSFLFLALLFSDKTMQLSMLAVSQPFIPLSSKKSKEDMQWKQSKKRKMRQSGEQEKNKSSLGEESKRT